MAFPLPLLLAASLEEGAPPDPVDEATAADAVDGLDPDELTDELDRWLIDLALRAEEGARRSRAVRVGLRVWAREAGAMPDERLDLGAMLTLALDLGALLAARPVAPDGLAPEEVERRRRCAEAALDASPRSSREEAEVPLRPLEAAPAPAAARLRARALLEALGCEEVAR